MLLYLGNLKLDIYKFQIKNTLSSLLKMFSETAENYSEKRKHMKKYIKYSLSSRVNMKLSHSCMLKLEDSRSLGRKFKISSIHILMLV